MSRPQDDLQALIEHFQNNNRVPRFEFFPDLWPTLEPMLLNSGFTLEMRAPLMAMTRDDFVPRDPMGAKALEDEASYRAYFDAASEAFGMKETPTDESVLKSLSQIESGYTRYAGIYEGDKLVAGGCVVGAGPIVELAGVATRESHRRRGLASAASSLLCAEHFERGGEIVWLSAGSDEARQVYAKLGFQLIGEQWNYSVPLRGDSSS